MKAIVSASPALNESLLATVFPTEARNTDMQTMVIQQSADLQMLRDHLQSSAEAVVVLFSRAEYAMASWVRSGWSLDKAAEHWQALVRDLLEIQKSQRQRILLVDCDHWLGQPELWPQRCLEAGYTTDVFDAIKPQADFVLLACCHYARFHIGIMQLNTLLQASSLPLTELDPLQTLPLDNVLHQNFLQQQQLAQLRDQLAAEQLLIQQQRQQLQTAERQINNADQLQRALEQSSKQRIAELQSILQQAQQQRVPLQHENELLLAQLHKVQEQLESALSTGQQHIQSLQHKLADTEAALSTELQLSSIVKNNANKADIAKAIEADTVKEVETKTDDKALRQAKQENAILLDQLFKLQEQLEDCYLQLRRQTEQPDNITATLCTQYRLDAVMDVLGCIVRDPTFLSSSALEDRLLLLSSSLFDPVWYLRHYLPAGRPIDAVEHYLTTGSAEVLNPGPEFDASAYLALHQDVAAAALDPLLHFERQGRTEGRQYQAVAKGVS